MADEFWTLNRLGIQHTFILQPHLPLIKVGRATDQQLQCKGPNISRNHFEFHRYKKSDFDDKCYWRILDLTSQSHVYVNKHIVPKHQFVSLNNNDLISIGGNNTENEALGNKNVFLYQIKAPSRWDCENIPEDENEDTKEDKELSGELEDDQEEEISRGEPGPSVQGGQKNRGKGHYSTGQNFKFSYRCIGYLEEDHRMPIYGVSVNHHLGPEYPTIFATVGINRVSIYEAKSHHSNFATVFLQCYVDPDAKENFYTCAWSFNPDNGKPLLAAAGSNGIIRVFCPATMKCIESIIGHTNSIYELKFHPVDPNLLLSASRDHNLRLWNIKTNCCIAIFGGVEGHRDEVVSADFDMKGENIMSCGLDHSLKLWKLDTTKIKEAIELSYSRVHTAKRKPKKSFPSVLEHFPHFSTRDIHQNYVDCCKWFGNFILSKSLDNTIVCWKPGSNLIENKVELERGDTKVSILHELDYKDCEIWFVKFSMDAHQNILALGNACGKTYLWDMDKDDPEQIRVMILSDPGCNSTIRQTSFSRDGSTLICACDDGKIFRWERQS